MHNQNTVACCALLGACRSNGKAALASTLHALQAGVPEHAGPNSSHEMSHTVRSGPLSAPHSRGEGLATQPSIASGSTSGAAIGPGPRVFYVVHAWESKFGDVVKAVLQHYESLVSLCCILPRSMLVLC